jgi:hypothetical protein
MEYEVTIQMGQNTAEALLNGGYSLYAFKAVMGPPGGTPVVWLRTQDFGLETNVRWAEEYQAYTMRQDRISADTAITAINPYPISLGGVLTVTTEIGTGAVTTGGEATAITIVNQTSTQFTCGLAQPADGSPAPFCAFPLTGGTLLQIIPLPKVLLMFATQPVDTGTLVESSYNQGMLIDLAGAPADPNGAARRQVSYDINAGWSAGGASWAIIVPADATLARPLIELPATVA